MNGVHDLGGMHGFGPVIREQNEPVFHADWEKRVFAMTLTAMGRGVCNVDEFRRAIERMPPAGYLAATYYEKWLHAVESLLVEKGVATREEIASGHAAAPAPPKATGSLGGGAVSSRSMIPRSSCVSIKASNPASRLATAWWRATSIRSIIRACRATRTANAASSATTRASSFSPIRTPTARAASRSTSTPWCSRPRSCGARTATSARRYTSIAGRTTSSAIAPPPNRRSSPPPKPPARPLKTRPSRARPSSRNAWLRSPSKRAWPSPLQVCR